MANLENISSLMDGELENDAAVRAIAQLKLHADDASGSAGGNGGAGRDGWHTYHLIGNVLRDGHAGAPAISVGFSARLSERLAQEPTVLAPRATRVPTRFVNQFQTYALSAAASVAAIAVVGWMALSNTSPFKPDAPTPAVMAKALVAPAAQGAALPQGPSQVAALVQQAAAPAASTAASASASAAAFASAGDSASEHMHEYLLAHQGISPTTAIQGVTPYVRTVSTGD